MIRSDVPPRYPLLSRRWWSKRRLAFAAIVFLTAAAATVFVMWALAPLVVSNKGPGPHGTGPLAVHLRELQDSVVP